MSFIPKPHEIYKHFKGNLYQIVAIAEHSETGEQLVIYQALYGDFKTYARPLAMFTGRVDLEKYPDAEQEFRFALQGPEGVRQTRESGAWTASSGQQPENREAEPATQIADEFVSQPEQEIEELNIDPLVLEFLDADSYEEKLNILAGLHHRITDDMITTMAIASDIEVDDGDTEKRYESLRNCLLTREKYECNRLC